MKIRYAVLRRVATTVPRLCLPALLMLALGVRLWGAGFGLPYLYHPDEPAHVLQALAVGMGLPTGLTFANPPLYKYLLLAEYGITYVVGRLAGLYGSPQSLIDQFRADPTLLYLIARSTSALLGAATVGAVYALAASLRGRGVGLVAAWLAAVAYLLVRESHFAVNDALVTLLVTLALFASIRVLQVGGRGRYALAGVMVGLSFAAKYQGLVSLLPLILAHGLRPRRRSSDLLIALLAAAAAILISFPSLVLETGRVLHDVDVHLYTPGQIGYDGLDPAGGYVYYLKTLALGVGLPILLAAGMGALIALARRDRQLLVVTSLPLGLYTFMGHESMYFARFILPAVPAMIVLAAIAVESLVGLLPRPAWVTRVAVLLLAAFLFAVPPLLDTLRFDALLMKEDTRTVARGWIEEHLPAGATVALDYGTSAPPLPQDRYRLLVANGWSLSALGIDGLRARGAQYLVASSYTYDLPLMDAASDAERRAFYTALSGEADFLVEFRSFIGEEGPGFTYDQIYGPFDHLERLRRPGPTIKVYRLPETEPQPDRSP